MRTLTLIWLKIATRKITYIAYIKSFIKHNRIYQTSADFQSVKTIREPNQEDRTRVVACALKIFGAIALLSLVPCVFTVSSRPVFTMLSVGLPFFIAMDCLKVANNLNTQSSKDRDLVADILAEIPAEILAKIRGFSLQGKSPVLQKINDAVSGTYILQPLFESAMRAHDIFKSNPASSTGYATQG